MPAAAEMDIRLMQRKKTMLLGTLTSSEVREARAAMLTTKGGVAIHRIGKTHNGE